MSAAPSKRQATFWRTFGPLVASLPRGSADERALLGVHSVRNPAAAQGEAHVLVEGSVGPFTLALRLSPAEACVFAQNVLAAAADAEAVQASIPGRASPCTSSK